MSLYFNILCAILVQRRCATNDN